ncbi:MAG: pentapeptide repeat-containing protein [Acidobacteriota bacterium]
MLLPQTSEVETLRGLAEAEDREGAIAESSRWTEERIAASGRGLDLTEAALEGLDLSGFDLRRSILNRALLHSTNLSGANLREASLICPGMERANFSGADLTGAYMHALAAQVVNFEGADLTDLVDATGALFHGCNLAGVRASGAVLAGTTFYQCDLSRADFTSANLQGAAINECVLDQSKLESALVSQLTITKCRMQDVDLRHASGQGLNLQRPTSCDGLLLDHANLPRLRCDEVHGDRLSAVRFTAVGADFHGCRWSAPSFAHADLTHSKWLSCSADGADLRGAKLSGASIRDCSLTEPCLEGASGENLQVVESDLRGAKMAHFAGRCAVFRDADLEGADLRHAYLYRAMLTGDPPLAMRMKGANLDSAVLGQAYLTADLRGASLRNANGVYARLNQSDLTGADLAGFNAFQASMVKTHLTGARLHGLSAPIFIDRCPGFAEAIAQTRQEDPEAAGLESFVRTLAEALKAAHRGST